MKLVTIGELKKLIENIDDDFKIDINVMTKLTEEQLLKSCYPYPWLKTAVTIEFHDIGYSDKEVCFGVYFEGDT